jgi:hypothetical protein
MNVSLSIAQPGYRIAVDDLKVDQTYENGVPLFRIAVRLGRSRRIRKIN